MEKELRSVIQNVLQNVTQKSAPKIYAAIQTESGYKTVEERIIRMMIDEAFTASACIMHIERSI